MSIQIYKNFFLILIDLTLYIGILIEIASKELFFFKYMENNNILIILIMIIFIEII